MSFQRLALLLLIGFWSITGQAASFDPDDQDCASILQRWAENPGSVPQQMVDLCKENMANLAPAAGPTATPTASAATDPCSGPDAANSVLCWGPWSSLAPAAGPAVASLDFPDFEGDCENGNELDGRCTPLLADSPPILEGCTPGAPCGFATIVDGVTSSADVEDTQFLRFDLDPKGRSFTIDPNGTNEIGSVPMSTNVQTHRDGYENMRSTGVLGEEQSRIVARVIRDEEDTIELAADVWGHGNRVTGSANSGYFAWGTATSISGLNLLNGNGISVSFTGPMSVDNGTIGSVTVDFGSRPIWEGNWENAADAWSFSAGGSVDGVNFISQPGQFSANVQTGVVQGALLGEPGRMGITHIIDVTLDGVGHIEDVGLLREIVAAPGIAP
ncbi:MAG: hypothetical protein FJ197_04605 [Gammaproteobacteria bacterium]|nr:hypothetical protein [Gammaproteobacteria bacterium]